MKFYKYQIVFVHENVQIPSSFQNGLNTNWIYEITIRIIERKEKKEGGRKKWKKSNC